VVASLKFGVATVLEGASKGAVLPTRELVSVESAVLSSEVASLVVVAGLHVPAIVDVPNGEVIGSGATEGVKAMEGDDEDIGPGRSHGTGRRGGRRACDCGGGTYRDRAERSIGDWAQASRIEENGAQRVAGRTTMGIAPGATIGDLVGVMADDRAGVPGVRGMLPALV